MNKVSIIIPVYNVEKYLAECLGSVLDQTYKNLEIILVNDGSTDRSSGICEEYKNKDSRIKLIHKENGGLSDARNAGISEITGDFVCFVDSDDIIAPDYIEKLLNGLTENGADISECDFFKFENTNELNKIPSAGKEPEVYSGEKGLELLLKEELKQTVWNKIYKRELIGPVLFEKDKTNEDEFWTYQVFGQSDKIVKIPERLYYYRQHPESIMGVKYNFKRLDSVEAVENQLGYMGENFPGLVPFAFRRLFFLSLYQYYWLLKSGLEGEKQERKKIMKRLSQYKSAGYRKGWKPKEHFWFGFFTSYPLLCVKARELLGMF